MKRSFSILLFVCGLCGCVKVTGPLTCNLIVGTGMASNLLAQLVSASTNSMTSFVQPGPSWLTSVLTAAVESTGLPAPALIGTVGSAAAATIASIIAGLIHRKRKQSVKGENAK